MGIGITDSKHYRDIANVIRKNDIYSRWVDSEGNISMFKPKAMADCIQEVISDNCDDQYHTGAEVGYFHGYDEGEQIGRDEANSLFWETFQRSGTRINYREAFRNYFTDDTYFPIYPINCTGSSNSNDLIFCDSKITDTKVDIDVRGCVGNAMFCRSKIKTIKNLIVNENTSFPKAFLSCSSLKEIHITGTIAKDIDVGDCVNLNLSTSVKNILEQLTLTPSKNRTATFPVSCQQYITQDLNEIYIEKILSGWTIAFR